MGKRNKGGILNTTLTRKEYITEANKWIQNNQKKWELINKNQRFPWTYLQKKILEPQFGKPVWTEVKGSRKLSGLVPDKNSAGTPFTIYNLKGKAHFKSDVTRKRTRGVEFRRASINEQTLSLDDYYKYADNYGYSDKYAEALYNKNVRYLNRIKQNKGRLLGKNLRTVYEHLIPTTSKTYGGVEHWRNILLWDDKTNTWKSDAMISNKAAIEAGIPRSKWDALDMDFTGKKALSTKNIRNIVLQDLKSRDLVYARQANKEPHLLSDFVSKYRPKASGAIDTVKDVAGDLLKSRTARVAGTVLTSAGRTFAKGTDFIDPVSLGFNVHGYRKSEELEKKVEHGTEGVFDAMGTATWIFPKLLSVTLPATVGKLQHEADERIRKNIDPNWWSGIGSMFGAPIGFRGF